VNGNGLRQRRTAFFATIALGAIVALPLSAQSTPPAPDLAAAQAAWERHPANVDSIVWYGRRVGYTGDFAAAVAIYTEGLRLHPDEPHLLRHRGHRYLSLRDVAAAIADLERAREVTTGRPDEIEPDGQPNARGIPTSTLHSNIRYHLALGHFLQGNFGQAASLWEEDAMLATNLDQRVAATFWWVLSLARLHDFGSVRAVLAPVRADWDIIENGSYHQLLLWMKRDVTDAALLEQMKSPIERQTIGNGMAQWHFAAGRRGEAEAAVRGVLATGPSASFGYLAAEVLGREFGIGVPK
jgi:tetratricopeptide (TPR) repeat protein